MRKRIFGLLALFFVPIALGFADPILVSIQPSTSSVTPGDTLTLDVDVANVTDLFAFQFDLGFSPGVLSALSITEGAFLPGGGTTFFIPGTIDNVGGAITATADSLIGTISGVNGNGTLAAVQFTALTLGISSVSLSNILLLDSNLSSISFSSAGGNVDVQGPTAVPQPSTIFLLGTSLLCVGLTRSRLFRHRA